MYLFRDVMDKQLVDRHGHKCGKVDDIVLELRSGGNPMVREIVTGHGALSSLLPEPIPRAVTWLERHVLGFSTVRPAHVGWEHVERIDVVVRLDLDREKAGLMDTETAIWQRWIDRIPRAER
jgi:sporulation protein YlmC with PRC-barrel domain